MSSMRLFRFAAPLLSLTASYFSLMPDVCAQQVVGGINVFPANNIFNTKVDKFPLDKNSSKYINKLGPTRHFHPDWGTNMTYGIPYNVVTGVPTAGPANSPIFDFDDESDPGPYPTVSTGLLIEGSDWSPANDGDRHLLQVDITNGLLYELYNTTLSGGQVNAGSGAIWNLNSNALRPDGWTSADAAGLPIFPLLVNYQEASGPGPIKHAFRMTGNGANGHIWPARHNAGSAAGCPPFGQRFRLKKSFNISHFSPINQKILTAMKEYGLIYSDNGSNWFVQGAPDPGWDDNDLEALKTLKGSDFEAVNVSSMMANPDSGLALTAKPVLPPAPTPTPWPKVH